MMTGWLRTPLFTSRPLRRMAAAFTHTDSMTLHLDDQVAMAALYPSSDFQLSGRLERPPFLCLLRPFRRAALFLQGMRVRHSWGAGHTGRGGVGPGRHPDRDGGGATAQPQSALRWGALSGGLGRYPRGQLRSLWNVCGAGWNDLGADERLSDLGIAGRRSVPFSGV